MSHRVAGVLGCLLACLLAGGVQPCAGQATPRDTTAPTRRDSTVKPPADTGARARTDTGARARTDTGARARTDTGPKPAAPKPPAPPANPVLEAICAKAPDLLLVTFRSRSPEAERDAALKRVNGVKVAVDAADDAVWYIRVPGEGNEFVLRRIADQLIRAPAVREVTPVQCPARP